ncbi:MAG: TIGR04076 family protein [Ignisphaera sp.]
MKSLLIRVKEIRGVCTNHVVGDCFRVDGGRLSLPGRNKHVCIYALSSILPLIPAKQRIIVEENDWLPRTKLVQCPDPNGIVIWEIVELEESTKKEAE